MKCPYCKKPAEWVENKEVYGKNYGKSFMMWLCKPCDARVGCHNNTELALGTMANKELREWRIKAHDHIDPIWKSGQMSRSKVYRQLNHRLGKQIHIGDSDIEMCKKIINIIL